MTTLTVAGVAVAGCGLIMAVWVVSLWARHRQPGGGDGGLEIVEQAMRPVRPDGYRGCRRAGAAPCRLVGRYGVGYAHRAATADDLARIGGDMQAAMTQILQGAAAEWPLVPLRTDPRRDTLQVETFPPPTARGIARVRHG